MGISTPSCNFFVMQNYLTLLFLNSTLCMLLIVRVAVIIYAIFWARHLVEATSQFISNFRDAGLLAIVQIGNRQFCTIKLCIWQAVCKWTISTVGYMMLNFTL